MNSSVTIEKLTTTSKTICTMQAWNGTEFVSKQITNSEAWKMEVSCAKAGYTSRVDKDEVVGDALHVIVTWAK